MIDDSSLVHSFSAVLEKQTIQPESCSHIVTSVVDAPSVEKAAVEESSCLANEDLEDNTVMKTLPQPDRGRQAWLFLLACFLLEGVVWGYVYSYGVFQAYYSTHKPFAEEKAGIAAIGTTATGLSYFATPFSAAVYHRWPQTRRIGIVLGFLVIVSSLVAASFCNDVPGLLATQGVLYSIGSLIIYFPVIIFIDEWFVVRKGIAYGVMWAGTGVSGAIIPFLLQWLLDRYGYRTTLRVWALCVSVILAPCLLFLKPRLPKAAVHKLRPKDLTFAKHAPFWLFEVGIIFQSLGYFLPPVWIPSFALYLGLPKLAGSLSVALMNIFSAFGSLLMGGLVDRFDVFISVLLCTAGSAVAAFLFWGLAISQAMLYTFSILWGVFGGGFVATWSGQAAAIGRTEKSGHVQTGMVLGLLAAGRGLGAVLTGPISSRIIESGWESHAALAYGTSYGGLIIFTGITVVSGGISYIGRVLKMV